MRYSRPAMAMTAGYLFARRRDRSMRTMRKNDGGCADSQSSFREKHPRDMIHRHRNKNQFCFLFVEIYQTWDYRKRLPRVHYVCPQLKVLFYFA